MRARLTLLPSALALGLAACGESPAPPPAVEPASPAAPSSAPTAAAPTADAPANPAADQAADTVQSIADALETQPVHSVEALKAEAAQADKSTLETVIANTKALIREKEKQKSLVEALLKAKTKALSELPAGKSTDSLKARIDESSAQLDVLKKELAGLNEKLQVYVAELAQRPA